jgi:hypothetical protein
VSLCSESRRGAFFNVLRVALDLVIPPLSPSANDGEAVCGVVLLLEPLRDNRGRVREEPPGEVPEAWFRLS